LITLSLSTGAFADPVAYNYTASEYVGLGGLSYWSAPVTLPDLSQGGTVSLGLGTPAAIGAWTPDQNGTIHQTIDNGFSFQLRYFPEGTAPDPSLPRLDVEGHVSGYLNSTPSGDREGGSFTGTVTHINLIDGQGGNNIPQPLIDLLAHPERIHITANSPGYVLSQLDTMLTIDPASAQFITPVPEPTTLASVAVFACGIAIRRTVIRASARRSSY
jgi:hypothetical protein